MRAVSLLFHDVYLTEPRESGFASDTADRYKLSIRAFDAQLAGVARVRADAPVLITELTRSHVSGGLTASAKATAVRQSFTQRRKASGYQDAVPHHVHPELGRVDDGEALWRSGRHGSPDRARRLAGSASSRSERQTAGNALAARSGHRNRDSPSSTQPSSGLKASGHRNAVPHLLTVDDGGVSYYTLLADRLESYGWRGHCFVSTDAIGRRGFLTAAQIRELDARGHVIGSHSASHPTRFSACDPARMRYEWAHSRQVLEQLLGHEVVAASLPGGYYSRQAADAAREAGLRVLFTSEPTTVLRDESGIVLVGRFTIRRGHPAATASRLVQRAPWTRYGEWARWHAKGLVKPVLGPLYMRVADWALRP